MRRRSPRATRASGLRWACAALACVAALVATPAEAAPSDPRLKGVRSFAFALGSGQLRPGYEARLGAYDLVVVDGEEARAGQVRALQARGTLVLGYLSVGTIEGGRGWYRAAKPYRLPDRFEEFDEAYADVSRPGLRRLLARRVAPRILAKGFDGLFLDNTDMIEGHPRQRRGMRLLVTALGRLTHGRGKLLFSQNGERSIGPSLRHYDGWNREDVTSTYSFERQRYERMPAATRSAALTALRRIRASGLLVTATDYVAAGDAATRDLAVAQACAAGALPFVADIGLTRLPGAPARC